MDRVLRRLGFVPVRQKGSHLFYRHPDGRTTTIPQHKGRDPRSRSSGRSWPISGYRRTSSCVCFGREQRTGSSLAWRRREPVELSPSQSAAAGTRAWAAARSWFSSNSRRRISSSPMSAGQP